MRKILVITAVLSCLQCLPSVAQIRELEGAFVEQLQARDSILVADQLVYGFELDDVSDGTGFFLPALADTLMRDVNVVRGWRIDTLKTLRKPSLRRNIRASVIMVPWEEGEYHLPRIAVLRVSPEGVRDTLLFDECVMDVRTVPVDTASFQIKDVKAPVSYPVTLSELLPYLLGTHLLFGLVTAVVCLIIIKKRKKEQMVRKEPAYIVALRKLDKFRGDRHWASDKQKAFYSGITDTLREYIAARFGVDAMEMTTAEIFTGLKSAGDITPELFNELKELFELADFVKFAKHTAPDEENVKALPTAVRFVTGTYQQELEEDSGNAEKKEVE